MSAQNPFQVPPCFKLDIEYRRRERFKKTVVTAVVVSVALVIGLLIEGCVNEKTQAMDPTDGPPPTSKVVPDQQTEPPVSKANSSNPPLQPCPVAMVPKTATPVAPPHTTGGAVSHSTDATVYLVKSGDTLSHIAKTCGTTVKALKSTNNLDNDRIVVGEKLKIPTA
jgi:LysM repeat protein